VSTRDSFWEISDISPLPKSGQAPGNFVAWANRRAALDVRYVPITGNPPRE